MPRGTVPHSASVPPHDALQLRTTAVPERMLLTVEEAADVLCVGRSLMYELIARHAIRTVRIGGCGGSVPRLSPSTSPR
jgi:excisionase family DNA binding protein